MEWFWAQNCYDGDSGGIQHVTPRSSDQSVELMVKKKKS